MNSCRAFGVLAKDDIWEKPRGGTVTIADMESERRLKAALGDLVPGSVVLAEEDAEENPGFDRVPERRQSGLDPSIRWTGPRNYAAGKDSFAMIVGLL